MKTWKSRLFGYTRCNFYCSMAMGIILPAASVFYVVDAFIAGSQSSESRLLLAIYVILLGQFSLGLTNYLALVSSELEQPPKT